MFNFRKKEDDAPIKIEKKIKNQEIVKQVYEADITYRRFKVHSDRTLIITDKIGIKVGDIIVTYDDESYEIVPKGTFDHG